MRVAPMTDQNEASDTTADDSMRNLLSHVPAEEAAEAMAEVAPDMTDEEKAAWLKRWKR